MPLVLLDWFAQFLRHLSQLRRYQSIKICNFHSSALCPQTRKIFRFKILVCWSVGKVERPCKITFFFSFSHRVLLQKSQMAEERPSLKMSNPSQLKWLQGRGQWIISSVIVLWPCLLLRTSRSAAVVVCSRLQLHQGVQFYIICEPQPHPFIVWTFYAKQDIENFSHSQMQMWKW